MTFSLVIAAIAVLPADRLAMADRLFNRGRITEARSEYRALQSEKSIAGDELKFRLAECERELGETNAARSAYSELVAKYPNSSKVARARLQLALYASGAERTRALQALTNEAFPSSVRAAAFYHWGIEKADEQLLARAAQTEPKGDYAQLANYARACLLAESSDAKVSRKGVELLLEFAFGNTERAEPALYLAATHCYRHRRYADAANLFRRYCKRFKSGHNFATAERLQVWCEYLEGRYTEVALKCSGRPEEDFVYLKAAADQALGEAQKADREFQSYLEKFPSGRYRAEAELSLARQALTVATSGTNWVRAVELSERVYRQTASAGDALQLAWAYVQAGRLEAAENAYREVTAKAPRTPESASALFARAMLAAQAENWSKAELCLAEALANNQLGERKATALYWRGVAAIRLGHENEAEEFLKQALALQLSLDESREARLMIAELELKAGRQDVAIQAYRQLLAEGAAERMSATRLKQVGEFLGGAELAICGRELMKQTDPEWRQVGATMVGTAAEAEGTYSAAITAYRSALREPVVTQAAATAALNLGNLEFRAGEYSNAEATLRRAVQLNQTSPNSRARAYLLLAQNALAQGDKKSAVGYATVIVSLFDDAETTAKAKQILAENPEEKP